ALRASPERDTRVETIQYLGVLDHSGRIHQKYCVSLGPVYAARGESHVAGVDGAECADEWRVERRSHDFDGSRWEALGCGGLDVNRIDISRKSTISNDGRGAAGGVGR